MDRCERVTLPMQQHIGTPCVPCVKPGERVLAGQLVGRAEAKLSSPIHASISGTVISVGEAVVIEGDGGMEHIETEAPQVHSRGEFLQAVRDSGLVGLGGAGFPTCAKFESAAGQANILLVNAAECEPYITADHREMLGAAPDLIEGIGHICKWLDIHEAAIGIESNKGDAITLLRALCERHSTPALKLRVGVLPARYPQGAEKIFIRSLTGRVVPLGKLPSTVGALTLNVAGAAFIGRYMRTGKPLISRTVTVDGQAVPRPMNVRVPLGVSLRALCALFGHLPVSGGLEENQHRRGHEPCRDVRDAAFFSCVLSLQPAAGKTRSRLFTDNYIYFGDCLAGAVGGDRPQALRQAAV